MTDRPYGEILGTEAGLRLGLSSGSCAQAAAKAALLACLHGEKPSLVTITLPAGRRRFSGKEIPVPVHSVAIRAGEAQAFVVKDAGDDIDCTGGLLIGAKVRLIPGAEGEKVRIDGGVGVGRVTKPGLAGEVGEAAINPVPRRMIRQELEPLLPPGKSCEVTVTVPGGEETAGKTWNPRLGIRGGISIIGTKGVVEPRSDAAYKASVNTVIHHYRENGITDFIVTSGYVGEKFLADRGVSLEGVVTVGDHIGHAVSRLVRDGGKTIIIPAHAGKLVKLCAGIFNTHWKSGDGRLEIIAAYAGACGAGTELIRDILDLKLAENAVELLARNGLNEVWSMVCRNAAERLDLFIEKQCGYGEKDITLGTVVLDLAGNPLACWPEETLESPLLLPEKKEAAP